MAIATAADFVAALRQLQLLQQAQLDDVARKIEGKQLDARTLAQKLIEHGWLSPYQVNQLLQGRGKELVLGSYVLLERLGEGGMGEVFKARHQKMGRVVAIKLIRKERLANEAAVKRFHREIRSAAVLSHPNVVHAFDADQVGTTHLFVMEYVEGVDLNKLVKEKGPLPVEQACDCIRQAALGLHHAHEQGLVHRDIKPHNLLLSRTGVVKILDMGRSALRNPHPLSSRGSTIGFRVVWVR
jgi:serine/threonine protein kinase